MANITGNPFKIQNCLVTLGANDYTALISQAELVPSTVTENFFSVGGAVIPMGGKATWVLTLSFAQDLETATSLSNYLFDSEGITVPFTIKPTGSAKGFTGSVLLQVTNQGGTANNNAASTVSLPVVGKPTRIPVV